MSILDLHPAMKAALTPEIVTFDEPPYRGLNDNMLGFASNLPATVFVPRSELDRLVSADRWLWQERHLQPKGERDTLSLMGRLDFEPSAIRGVWLAAMLHSLVAYTRSETPPGWQNRRLLREMLNESPHRDTWHHLTGSTYPGAGWLAGYFQEPSRRDEVLVVSEYEAAMVCASHVIVRYKREAT